MKKLVLLGSLFLGFISCDKTYVCDCAHEAGGLPYKKVYLKAKSERGAERRCDKQETGSDSCDLQ